MNIDSKDYTIVFHGASNDKVDDPDNKKLLPPSPSHPFFVSKDPSVAVEYTQYPTKDDGRIEEDDSKSKERVYMLRLDNSKLKIFNIFNAADLRKLSPYFSKASLKGLREILINEKTALMYLGDDIVYAFIERGGNADSVLAKVLRKIIQDNENGIADASDLVRKLKDHAVVDRLCKKYYDMVLRDDDYYARIFPLCLDFLPEMLGGDVAKLARFVSILISGKPFSKSEFGISRRTFKGILFSHISELGYNAIYERDTADANSDSTKLLEIGLFSLDPIVDACPTPLDVGIVKNAIENYIITYYGYGYLHTNVYKNLSSKTFLKFFFKEIERLERKR